MTSKGELTTPIAPTLLIQSGPEKAFQLPSALAPAARSIKPVEPVPRCHLPLAKHWVAGWFAVLDSRPWEQQQLSSAVDLSSLSLAGCLLPETATTPWMWFSPSMSVSGRPCLPARGVVHLPPAPGAPCEPRQLPHTAGSIPQVPSQPGPRDAKDPINASASPAHATASGGEGAPLRRQPDLRKILIIRQLPAGWRGEGLRLQRVRAAPGSAAPVAPAGGQGCRRAPSCRAAAPGPRPACRRGASNPQGKPYFRHLAVGLRDKKAIKNEKGGGSRLEGFPQHGLAWLLLSRAGGDAQSSARGSPSVTYHCPESPCEDRAA